MPQNRFKFHQRLKQFSAELHQKSIISYQLIIYSVGWLLLLISLLLFINGNFLTVFLPLLFLIILSRKIFKEVQKKITPPSEILLLFLLTFMFLERGWFAIMMNTGQGEDYPGVLALIPQIGLLALIIFTLFFLLIMNNRGKSRVLYLYTLLGFISLLLLQLSDQHFWTVFQVILVFIFFRQTSWAEKLTKVECWIYFMVIGIITLNYETLPYLDINETTVYSFSWYFLPKILSHFIWIYLLSTLLKIPFVLVYHHASLGRKFKIAGWLQSSIPQFIQLIILLMVFYFFIGGWQAENLKSAIITQVNRLASSDTNTSFSSYRYAAEEFPLELKIPGYDSLSLQKINFDNAVIPITRKESNAADYFLVHQLRTENTESLQLVKIDSLFLKSVSQELVTVAASGLISYPFRLAEWDSILYDLRWMMNREGFQDMRVFPFALTPYQSEHTSAIRFRPGEKGKFVIMRQDIFTAGRVFLPVINSKAQETGLWAFDVVIIPTFSFFSSSLMRQVLFWLVVYTIINLLVIRRVIKFGNQITDMIVRKFDQLTVGIRQISDGNLEYKIDMEGEDEFVELADRFNQMGIELQQKISEVREKDRLEHELRIARDVQLSLLPRQLPEIRGYRVSAHIRTATEVGGDFYDVLPLNNDQYLFVIGDVSGKGTSAAFFMAQCVSLIRFSKQFTSQPKDIMVRLNQYFSDPAIDRQIFVTAIIGLLDTKKNSISFLRAGHNLPLFIPADENSAIQELKSKGLGLGLERKGDLFQRTLKSKTIRLQSGDAIFLYTDGLVEASAFHPSGDVPEQNAEFFGEQRLMNLLKSLRGRNTDEIIEDVNRTIRIFYGNSPLIDDLTMMVIQRK